jgi:tetratricopeptide (TPR) repeat protein
MIDFRVMREAALRGIETRLQTEPDAIGLRFERARMLDSLGRPAEAKAAFADVLRRDPMHFQALCDLGTLQFKNGDVRGARISFQTLADRHPGNSIAHANLGFMLLKNGELAAARDRYARAVELDPKSAEARKGLGLVLEMLGETASAREHADRAFREAPLTSTPYRGNGSAPEVLAIVSFTAGNVHLQHYVTPEYFGVHKLVAEYADLTKPLPPHDVIFNAVGDADLCGPALDAARAIVAKSSKPIINAPDAVAATTRAGNAARLRGIPGVVTPTIMTFDRATLTGPKAATALWDAGFAFPLLLRAPGFHTGEHFERVEHAGELAAAVARLPGEQILALEFINVRDDDGQVRKYRAMFIGESIEPLHLAISRDWKVHYLSADMADNEANRAEDAAYLADLPGTLGEHGVWALDAIRTTLGLDYAGIDFGFDSAGNVVVFEANATMIVPIPKSDPRWNYRRPAVERIHRLTRELIACRASP